MRNMKDQISSMFYKSMGNDDFRDEVLKKSNKGVKELKIESYNIFETADFNKLKKAKLNHVGSFQTAKHSSHHVLCADILSHSFVVTGHSDSTFKIWYMSPNYFQTQYSASQLKPVQAKELVEEDFDKKKKNTGPKAFELVICFKAGIRQRN